MYCRTEAMSMNLHIEDYQKNPFPFAVYLAARDIYSSTVSLLTMTGKFVLAFLIVILALATSLIWVTALYFLFISSRRKAKTGFEEMISKWQDASPSAEMFDELERLIRTKQVMEKDGKFRRPKKFKIFRPFFKQVRLFYEIYDAQTKWLEEKLYPTAEELGIPPEDIEYMKAQMTAEDYADLRDPDWIQYEKKCLLN